jgi:hypothetical protein
MVVFATNCFEVEKEFEEINCENGYDKYCGDAP